MSKNLITFVLCGALAITASSRVSAQEEAAQISPEQEAILANMQAYGTINENHDLLASLAGSWDAEIQYWMNPQMPPQTSEGIMESDMILGGKFLEQIFISDMEGQEFEGRGVYSYDNIQQKFQSIWFDSMGTGIMISSGQFDAATRQIKEEGQLSCPITNDQRWYRAVTTLVDDDHYTLESFMKDEDGNEYKSMTISFSRAN